MKKPFFPVIPAFVALFSVFFASCSSDTTPTPEPEEPIFGTYEGNFTTDIKSTITYQAGGTSIGYYTQTKPGSIIFRAGLFNSVRINYRGNFYFTDSFNYTGNYYYQPHSGGGARTILFDTKMKAVKLTDSFCEKGPVGSPEDHTGDTYEKITITTFIGTKK